MKKNSSLCTSILTAYIYLLLINSSNCIRNNIKSKLQTQSTARNKWWWDPQQWGNLDDNGCIGLKQRKYSSILWNIPGGKTWDQACYGFPGTDQRVKGTLPNKCSQVLWNEWGEWYVNDNSCVPNWGDIKDDGCVSLKKRKYSAILWNIPGDWTYACQNWPGRQMPTLGMVPNKCNQVLFQQWGEWYVDDNSCVPNWGDIKNDGCVDFNKRKYSAILWNIPGDWTYACQNWPGRQTPTLGMVPNKCDQVLFQQWGEWQVEDNTCPHWEGMEKRACDGSQREFASRLVDIPIADWDAACYKTPGIGQFAGRIPTRCSWELVHDTTVWSEWGYWKEEDPTCICIRQNTTKDCLLAEESDINGSKSKCIPVVPSALTSDASCVNYRTQFISKGVTPQIDYTSANQLLSQKDIDSGELLRYYTQYAFSLYKNNSSPADITNFSNLNVGTFSASFGFENNKEQILVIFRGTEEQLNWLYDITFAQTTYEQCSEIVCGNARVHSGFYEAFQLLQSGVTKNVDSLIQKHPDSQISFVGHSLGGALAGLAALNIQNAHPNKIVNYFSYGSPRFANPDLANYFNSVIKGINLRAVYKADVIPALPFQNMGIDTYQHVGTEIHFFGCDMNSQLQYATNIDTTNTYVLEVADHGMYCAIDISCEKTNCCLCNWMSNDFPTDYIPILAIIIDIFTLLGFGGR